MTLCEAFQSQAVTVSCEIFPPKAFKQMEEVTTVAQDICQLKPAFVSVTYGAGGKGSSHTIAIAKAVKEAGVEPLFHFTCMGADRASVDASLADIRAQGIHSILALRGDIPEGERAPSAFPHASDLIAYIKKVGSFTVGAACYPQGHPESRSKAEDLDYLKRKVDAGADFLTTQMFFDNNVLYNFLYRALQKGIQLPIAAGIMPVVNAKQIKRICSLSAAALPPRFAAIVDRFQDDPQAMSQAGIAFATEQIIDLVANGVNHIHLYTMNRPHIAQAIFNNLSCIIGGRA
ncbi:MAG: methylenetetrahydrofolate reductase [Clostridia bacterium]|nr:methylenetetrahydrofolate reductase [Clostridia bacterium]